MTKSTKMRASEELLRGWSSCMLLFLAFQVQTVQAATWDIFLDIFLECVSPEIVWENTFYLPQGDWQSSSVPPVDNSGTGCGRNIAMGCQSGSSDRARWMVSSKSQVRAPTVQDAGRIWSADPADCIFWELAWESIWLDIYWTWAIGDFKEEKTETSKPAEVNGSFNL